MPDISDQVRRRRTFAIISHPDAGKTTLTEKLLLFGGAIQLAGTVKARKSARHATSDWMEVEKQRGISVTSSVMQFEYQGHTINLLDTPGHEDFSEDTYRTLTAADCAIMVLDAAKGIEPQTLKLFEVCRLRDIPIITFINKLDREAQDPMALLDEIASRLQLDPAPIWWPAQSGNRLRGMVEMGTGRFQPYARKPAGSAEDVPHPEALPLSEAGQYFEAGEHEALLEAQELVEGGYPAFDRQSFLEGHMTPVLWGSALRHFGIDELLAAIGEWAPPPKVMKAHKAAPAGTRNAAEPVATTVEPGAPEVTGFVFKVQANMDPKHRDRVAFVRLASGHFERGMKLNHVRTKKPMSITNPVLFLAADRELAEEAWAGDIIGIPNHGQLRIGDALTEGEALRFTGIPSFAPELLQGVRAGDPMKAKHLEKALMQFAEEGAAKVFKPMIGSGFIVGVVGALQFEVLASRIEQEYSLPVRFEPSNFTSARWVAGPKDEMEKFINVNKGHIAVDNDGATVFLTRLKWDIDRVERDYPALKLTATKEMMV